MFIYKLKAIKTTVKFFYLFIFLLRLLSYSLEIFIQTLAQAFTQILDQILLARCQNLNFLTQFSFFNLLIFFLYFAVSNLFLVAKLFLKYKHSKTWSQTTIKHSNPYLSSQSAFDCLKSFLWNIIIIAILRNSWQKLMLTSKRLAFCI